MNKDVATASPLRFKSSANDSTGQFKIGDAIAANPPPINVSSEYDNSVDGYTSKSANNTVFQLKAELKPTALKQSFEDTNQKNVLQQFREAQNKITGFNYSKDSNQPEKFNFYTSPNTIQLTEYESGHKELKETGSTLLKNQTEPDIATSSDIPVLQGFGFLKKAASSVGNAINRGATAVGRGINNVGSGIRKGAKAAKQGATTIANRILDAGAETWESLRNLPGSALERLKGMGMNLVKGGLSGISNLLGNTAGLLDRAFGPKGQEVTTDEIPSRHIMDEFLAHRISYKNAEGLIDGSALSENEITILQKGGYDPFNMAVRTGSNGFQAVMIMPAQEGILPMLAFRGTADLGGIMTDMDPKQVGDFQFINNSTKIEELIGNAGGMVDVCGHSLGGAIAQLTVAYYTSKVGRCTTFQSPGINKEAADAFRQNLENIDEADRPAVAHHIVKNDLVSKAGQENIDGAIYEHDMGNLSPLDAHSSSVFGTRDFNEARSRFGITDEYLINEVGNEIKQDVTIRRFEEQPYQYQRLVAEFVRSGAGVKREGGIEIVSRSSNFIRNARNRIKGFRKRVSKFTHRKIKNVRKKLNNLFAQAKKTGGEGLFKLKKALDAVKN